MVIKQPGSLDNPVMKSKVRINSNPKLLFCHVCVCPSVAKKNPRITNPITENIYFAMLHLLPPKHAVYFFYICICVLRTKKKEKKKKKTVVPSCRLVPPSSPSKQSEAFRPSALQQPLYQRHPHLFLRRLVSTSDQDFFCLFRTFLF